MLAVDILLSISMVSTASLRYLNPNIILSTRPNIDKNTFYRKARKDAIDREDDIYNRFNEEDAMTNISQDNLMDRTCLNQNGCKWTTTI